MANVLGELFSDIATSIRSGLGEVDKMKPTSFPAKIDEIVALIGTGSGSGDTGSGEIGGGNIGTLKFKSGSFTTPGLGKDIDFKEYEFAASDTYPGTYTCVIPLTNRWATPDAARAVSWDYAFSTMHTPISGVSIAGRTQCYCLGNQHLVKPLAEDTGGNWLIIYSPNTFEMVVFTTSNEPTHAIGICNPAITRVSQTVTHGLGEMPDFVMVCYAGILMSDVILEAFPNPVVSVWGFKSEFKTHTERLGCISTPGAFSPNSAYGIDNMNSAGQTSGYIYCPDENTFKVGRTDGNNVNFQFVPGGTYYWVAIANMGGSDLPSAEEVSF